MGRIPVYNAQYSTLDSILTKTINYENASNISWRQNMLLPMGISNYANEDGGGDARCDGHTLGDYIKSDLATPNGYGSYTMYEKSGLTPVTATCNAADHRIGRGQPMEHQPLWNRRLVGAR